jgi:periplasmic protein TonB
MPREIFGEVSNPSAKLGSQAWYTVPLSILVHAALIAVVIVVPLVATGTLPDVQRIIEYTPADAKLPEPPPPPASPSRRATPADPQVSPDAAPTEAPDAIAPEVERPPVPGTPPVVGGIDFGGGPGVGAGVNIGPPPPAPAPPPQRPAFVRPGGDIKTPTKIHHVAPVYPAIAQQAKVEGNVILEATIGTDGRVKDLRVLSSKPLLDQAAISAVMQWRFTPTLLNGVPVPVLMTVTVTFTLR